MIAFWDQPRYTGSSSSFTLDQALICTIVPDDSRFETHSIQLSGSIKCEFFEWVPHCRIFLLEIRIGHLSYNRLCGCMTFWKFDPFSACLMYILIVYHLGTLHARVRQSRWQQAFQKSLKINLPLVVSNASPPRRSSETWGGPWDYNAGSTVSMSFFTVHSFHIQLHVSLHLGYATRHHKIASPFRKAPITSLFLQGEAEMQQIKPLCSVQS